MSIGCGATPDLMALEYFREQNSIQAPLSYIGYEKNFLWKPIHEGIEKYGQGCNIKVKFVYEDAVSFFQQYYVECFRHNKNT